MTSIRLTMMFVATLAVNLTFGVTSWGQDPPSIPSHDPWSPELIPTPEDAFDRATVMAMLLQFGEIYDRYEINGSEITDEAWAELLPLLNTDIGLLIGENWYGLSDQGPYHRDRFWLEPEALRDFLPGDTIWLYPEELDEWRCDGSSCRVAGYHSYMRFAVRPNSAGQPVLMGIFTGDSIVSDSREREVEASERAWDDAIDERICLPSVERAVEAQTLLDDGQLIEAEALLVEAVEMCGELIPARLALAEIYALNNRLDEAITELAAISQLPDQAALFTIDQAQRSEVFAQLLDDPRMNEVLRELRADPPDDPDHLIDYIQRFDGIESRIDAFFDADGVLPLVECPEDVFDLQVSPDVCTMSHLVGEQSRRSFLRVVRSLDEVGYDILHTDPVVLVPDDDHEEEALILESSPETGWRLIAIVDEIEELRRGDESPYPSIIEWIRANDPTGH